ncbi:MAG: BrnT family toxin [Proteobacteria bacterium]|nr:BrnT family toxin [Pseudomonadota bacterium]
MPFEFDVRKSRNNKVKHGIDFEEARSLWTDPNAIIVPVMVEPEARWIVVGLIFDLCWTAVITFRESNVRIISCRRARKKEIQAYENQKK